MEYFKGRSKIEHRACIKATENYKGETYIIDIFRSKKQMYVIDCSVNSNTGFYEVINTGKSFLCNNIPSYVKDNRYVNPRLKKHKAMLYKISKVQCLKNNFLGHEDKKWIECWDDIMIDGEPFTPPVESCYKSTLIIPMTLLGNTLMPEYKRLFKIDGESERTIYGFLCFDHHEMNYFEEDIDVSVGYIFADMLSLYFITLLTYADYSKTYNKVKNFLDS